MVSNEGETRLLGFEVAPGLRDLAASGAFGADVTRYLAPEALTGGAAVDRADDVYSLGVILFELLTCAPLPRPRADGYAAVIDAARDLPGGGAAGPRGQGAAQAEPGAAGAAHPGRPVLAQGGDQAARRRRLQRHHLQPRLLHAQPLPQRDRAGVAGDRGREDDGDPHRRRSPAAAPAGRGSGGPEVPGDRRPRPAGRRRGHRRAAARARRGPCRKERRQGAVGGPRRRLGRRPARRRRLLLLFPPHPARSGDPRRAAGGRRHHRRDRPAAARRAGRRPSRRPPPAPRPKSSRPSSPR